MAGKKNNKVTKKVAKNEAAIAPRFNQSLSAPEEWQHQENGQSTSSQFGWNLSILKEITDNRV
jgi:hypothetical protein